MQHDPLDQAVWRKANNSGDGNCVEVATTPEMVGVRDTKDRSGPILRFAPDAWSEFVTAVKGGNFDRR